MRARPCWSGQRDPSGRWLAQDQQTCHLCAKTLAKGSLLKRSGEQQALGASLYLADKQSLGMNQIPSLDDCNVCGTHVNANRNLSERPPLAWDALKMAEKGAERPLPEPSPSV